MADLGWTQQDIATACSGQWLSQTTVPHFSSINIDSRSLTPDQFFIAIPGKNHDGHAFINDAIQKGCLGILVQKNRCDHRLITVCQRKNIACIQVDDSVKALGDLARYHRNRSGVKVVAITGSNGKTSTKELTAHVLSQRFSTLYTLGNFNNEIGLPLTLLRLNSQHQMAVIELGMNHIGEISRLADICIPDIGIITNIGYAHLEGVGSIEGVIQAKGELIEKLSPAGHAVLNADNPWVMQLAKKTNLPIHCYGISETAQVRADKIQVTTNGSYFELVLPTERIPINLPAIGRFMVHNALAAACTGYILGLSGHEIQKGLTLFRPVSGRMNIMDIGQIHVVNDTYNANPSSMEASILTFMEMNPKNRGFLVLGDMFELGVDAEKLHRNIGEKLGKLDGIHLFATGQLALQYTLGAKSVGMPEQNVFWGSKPEIRRQLKNQLQPGDWVFVKGSRGMNMETIVAGLQELNIN
ncbi:MAG: UDP-N-acetylmuramoyl-tripeptide--D-alanyl-D-alanine ligase [Desulfobacterales bacterium]|nr:UDP-N-acetylmuramoyl-tripeptide--D-alanyl-D-alanine ligase [Desulfobacterales bacterium]